MHRRTSPTTDAPGRLHAPPGRRRGGWAIALTAAMALGATGQAAALPAASPAPAVDFGPNVTVFDPSMPISEIQAKFDEVWDLQRNNEMGSERYGLYFLPGTYGTAEEPLQVKVGYYTEVAGLGEMPGDVQINGKIESKNRCFDENGDATDDPSAPGYSCFALNNFWRTLANLTINVNGLGQDGCAASANFWAVSQAVSMRRVEVTGGNLSLMDYCSAGPQYASGGYIADSRAGFVINGSQQQWLTRNSEVGGWSNAVWNQVFSGVVGAPDDSTFPNPPYTTLDTTPVSREKPFLFVDDAGAYQVRVPSAHVDTRGISWGDGPTSGRTIPLSSFFVARPGDSVQAINNQLAAGRHLILTPGVYDVARSIDVKRPDTVVLGLGQATLTAVGGAIPLTIADRPGVVVAGVTIDGGPVESPVLLRVGTRNGNNGTATSDPANPTTLSDVYFRIGGPHIGKADITLQVNSDHVLIDHTWVWRADHGIEGFTGGNFKDLGDNERWATNIGRNGVVVNGDDVTATGLFVEHFQQYNTVWNGERGRVVLYQNELPYDPPTQADWTAPDGTLGWAAYKVADHVTTHRLWGGGAYVYNRNNPDIITENGFEVPDAPGVQVTHVLTVNLDQYGTIRHVINGVGGQVDSSNTGVPSYVTSYP